MHLNRGRPLSRRNPTFDNRSGEDLLVNFGQAVDGTPVNKPEFADLLAGNSSFTNELHGKGPGASESGLEFADRYERR